MKAMEWLERGFCFLRFYLFIFREGKGREKEREINIHVWLPLVHPYQEPGPQPRHVPQLGIKSATLWFTGPCTIY